MAGVADLSQLFTDDGANKANNSDSRTRKRFIVPEPPIFKEIPDLHTLFGGDGRNSLLDLQPCQCLPSEQMSEDLEQMHSSKHGASSCLTENVTVSERGDSNDILLGSQYPLIYNIGPSQVPKSIPDRVWNFQSSQRFQPKMSQSKNCYSRHSIPNQTTEKKDSRAFVCPRKTDPLSTGERTSNQPRRRIYSATQKHRPRSPTVNTENNSQEDLFDDSEYQSTASVGGNGLTALSRIPSDELYSPAFVAVPLEQYRLGVRLKPITEIPGNFQRIFNFPHFNIVQSKVFDDVMYTDKSLVLCSPTGSGKTAVFEMAIVRLMSRSDANFSRKFKVVYMAPIKALCSERYSDWKEKFEPYGLKVMELTGDTDTEEFYELQQVNIVLTTPEKWDSMTRKWRDNKSVMQAICLFLIDEIHVLNDPTRGSVVEAVVSRMKTIQAARQRAGNCADLPVFRFVAISATITNIEDLAEWLGHGKTPAVHYKFDDSARPVRLRKVVLGYHFAENKQSEFQFDISLSYKLAGVINTYSDDKPTLIFCATRKSSMQGAEMISRDVKGSYVRNAQHRLALQNHSFHVKDTKLRDLVVNGIGYHHAGMDVHDRKLIEEIFANGELPVLVATSTLAMGVNLPAHLVIIKSTMYYNMGTHQEYPDTQVLQMIGRAGRPQFDTSATAVIMTKNTTKMKYENLLNGTQQIESSLHKNLVEHLNAEIVLNTITDISVAVEWMKYTFLYIRVMKNPAHYGMPNDLRKQAIEKRLQDMCIKGLKQLHRLDLIQMNEENMDVRTTESGRLMARYCISYKTAELFLASFKGDESISDMLNIISKCEEFSDIILRNNEKKTLNTLNKDKNRITIRQNKVNRHENQLATFGSLLIQDFALQQDIGRIFRAGIRVTRCLVELLSQKNNFRCLLSAILLCKCFKAKLWDDSKYVSKQLDGIGPTLSTALVNAGLTSFEKLEEINPREIELIVNRHPPFGNQVKENVTKLPKYELVIEQVMRYSVNTAEIVITIQITNRELLKDSGSTGHTCTMLVGDADNKVIYKQRIMDAMLLKEVSWSKKLEVRVADKGPELSVHYISQDWVGLDVECSYSPTYLGSKRITSSGSNQQQANIAVGPGNNGTTTQPCQHSCHNKMACGHDCCKHGVTSRRKNNGPQQTPKLSSTKPVANHVLALKNKSSNLPLTPSLSKRARLQDNSNNYKVDLDKFAFTPNRMKQACDVNMQEHSLGVQKHQFNTYEVGENRSSSYRGRKGLALCPSAQGDGREKKSRNDWAELDMYARNRQNCNTAPDNDNEESITLPDLDDTFDELADPGPNWHSLQNNQHLSNMEDDFAQETDYGYTYVCGEDKNALPGEWDDRITDQVQGSRGKGMYMKTGPPNANVRALISDRRQKPFYRNRFSTGKQTLNNINNVPETPCIQLNDNNQSDYDIEDYSDESFDAAVNGEPVAQNKRLNSRQTNLQPLVNIDEYADDENTVYYQNSIGAMPSKDTSLLYRRQSEYRGPSNRASYISGCEDDKGAVLRKWNAAVQNGQKVDNLYGSFAKIDCSEIDNIDPEFYDEMYSGEQETNQSKWTNYFSSQSSTASDNLNWRYPTRTDENKVVMQARTSVQDRNSQQVPKPNEGRTTHHLETVTRKVDDDRRVHKYGQVLAWVSNSENHQFNGLEENERTTSSDDLAPRTNDDKTNTQFQKASLGGQRVENSRRSFFSTLKSSEKGQTFAEIFEGIL